MSRCSMCGRGECCGGDLEKELNTARELNKELLEALENVFERGLLGEDIVRIKSLIKEAKKGELFTHEDGRPLMKETTHD